MRFRVVSAYHRRGGGRVEAGAEVTLDARDAERLVRLGCVEPIAEIASDSGDDIAAALTSEPQSDAPAPRPSRKRKG